MAKTKSNAASRQKDNSPTFTCTADQKRAALKFLDRIIEAQKVIGPHDCGMGGRDILHNVDLEYKGTIERLLETQGRFVSSDSRKAVFGAVVINEKAPGFILRTSAISDNGTLSEQAQNKDYHFAVNGRRAVAYDVRKAGKSRYSLAVYFGVTWSHDDIAQYKQTIDIDLGYSWQAAFVCPYCDENTNELLLTTNSYKFGCVTCLTILDSDELAIYQKTASEDARAKKGGTHGR